MELELPSRYNALHVIEWAGHGGFSTKRGNTSSVQGTLYMVANYMAVNTYDWPMDDLKYNPDKYSDPHHRIPKPKPVDHYTYRLYTLGWERMAIDLGMVAPNQKDREAIQNGEDVTAVQAKALNNGVVRISRAVQKLKEKGVIRQITKEDPLRGLNAKWQLITLNSDGYPDEQENLLVAQHNRHALELQALAKDTPYKRAKRPNFVDSYGA